MYTQATILGMSRHRLTTDGQGVTTLVAFVGCPLRCTYCLNPECHDNPKLYNTYTPQKLYDELKIDDLYFKATNGGVTFSGGEPMLQSRFIKKFRKICGKSWHINIETSLNVSKKHIMRLLPIVDEYIIDIKDMSNDTYHRYTQLNNNQVIDNIKLLIRKDLAKKIVVRIPLIKNYNTDTDCENSIKQLERMGLTRFDRFEYVIREFHKNDTNKKESNNTLEQEESQKIILTGCPVSCDYDDLPF